MDLDLDVAWIHGVAPGEVDRGPAIQVHRVAEGTWILRQSRSVHFEAPFLYLFCGDERAMLVDTGATAEAQLFPLRQVVDDLLADRVAARPGYGLLVAHTHAHDDHVAGDEQLRDRPHTLVVPHSLTAVRAAFGLGDDTDVAARVDLGSRVLEVLAIPGHHETSVAFHDPWTGLLLTGDTVYPGRLYVDDLPAFVASLERLIAFCRAHRVSHVLGCHVEMTDRPGQDYPRGTRYQPDEAPLAMSVGRLVDVREAAAEARAGGPRVVRDGFVVVPVAPSLGGP